MFDGEHWTVPLVPMNFNSSPKMKRSSGARGTGRQRTKTPQNPGSPQGQVFDGLYQNDRLVNSVTSVLGCTARVTGKSGKTFEGVFKTISPEGSLVLGKANPVEEQQQNGVVGPIVQKNIFEQFVMNKKDWVKVDFQDVDLEECYLRKDGFKTDATIAKKVNGQPRKELEKWEPSGGTDGPLEMAGLHLEGPPRPMSNGWSADEMFHVNAQKYGVKSTYREEMEEYTTKLEKSDTPEYREKEKIAAKKAEEIMNESPYERGTLDSGRTEEALYSSVVRTSRSSQPNWRDRPEKDQRSQRLVRDGSGSPAMTRREPAKSSQVDEAPKIQIKEKVVKAMPDPVVESKPETKVEVASELTKDTKPTQSVSSVKPETPPKESTAETSDKASSPQMSSTDPNATTGESKTTKDPVLQDLKSFSANFQLAPEEKKTKKTSDENKKVLKEKKKEEKTTETPEEPQPPQESKTESEITSPGKKPFSLNPNAQEFRPGPAKRNTPSPRSTSTPSSGGAPSPFQAQSPYGMPPYQGGGMYRQRTRGVRQEYMEPPNYVNATNAAGQPFFAQQMAPFMHAPPSNMPFIRPMPATPPVFIPGIQHGQGPMMVPMGQMGTGHYGEPTQIYYSPHAPVQMLQSPPQIQSPSLPQSAFNFSSAPVPLTSTVRPVSQIPPQAQQPMVLQPTQIITSSRPPPATNYQGN